MTPPLGDQQRPVGPDRDAARRVELRRRSCSVDRPLGAAGDRGDYAGGRDGSDAVASCLGDVDHTGRRHGDALTAEELGDRVVAVQRGDRIATDTGERGDHAGGGDQPNPSIVGVRDGEDGWRHDHDALRPVEPGGGARPVGEAEGVVARQTGVGGGRSERHDVVVAGVGDIDGAIGGHGHASGAGEEALACAVGAAGERRDHPGWCDRPDAAVVGVGDVDESVRPDRDPRRVVELGSRARAVGGPLSPASQRGHDSRRRDGPDPVVRRVRDVDRAVWRDRDAAGAVELRDGEAAVGRALGRSSECRRRSGEELARIGIEVRIGIGIGFRVWARVDVTRLGRGDRRRHDRLHDRQRHGPHGGGSHGLLQQRSARQLVRPSDLDQPRSAQLAQGDLDDVDTDRCTEPTGDLGHELVGGAVIIDRGEYRGRRCVQRMGAHGPWVVHHHLIADRARHQSSRTHRHTSPAISHCASSRSSEMRPDHD